MDPRLNIILVNEYEKMGGAALMCWNLYQSLASKGHTSWMAVGHKNSSDPNVFLFPNETPRYFDQKMLSFIDRISKPVQPKRDQNRISIHIRRLGEWRSSFSDFLGVECFEYPGTWELLNLPPLRPNVVHLHNLHNRYFDLRFLPVLSSQVPTVITLHDAWLLSGLCAHSFDCEKWKTGCGGCPYLNVYPKAKQDATRYNWRRKREIYSNSQLYIAAPSKWLADRVSQSILSAAAKNIKIIPNGINLNIFHPWNKNDARSKLNIPVDKKVLLFASMGTRTNPYKDYKMVEEAIRTAASEVRDYQLLFISLGDDQPTYQMDHVEFRSIPPVHDPYLVANYYQAADVFLYGSRVDTFPTTILEAMACGTAVIASNVGGISDQIEDGVTGFLVPPSDSPAMAQKINLLLADDPLRERIATEAAAKSVKMYGQERMVDAYLDFYHEVIDDWRQSRNMEPCGDSESHDQ